MPASWAWPLRSNSAFRSTGCGVHTPVAGADPGLSLLSTEQSRERGGHERSAELDTTSLSRPGAQWLLCRDTLMPEQPDTYVNLAEDDVNDAANHYEEVEDVPGVPKVALSGKSQRRVNNQGTSQG